MTPLCTVEGCDRTVVARGWCGSHYKRWQRYGDPNMVLKDISPIPSGTVFGRLIVEDVAAERTKHGARRYLSRCSCGNTVTVAGSALTSGLQLSCGCLKSERARARQIVHGLGGTPIYSTWFNMIRRCSNSDDPAYPDYGGRGITVCDRWQGSLGCVRFYDDMGPKPTKCHSIDRIDNDGPYSVENCRWASKREQAANKRPMIRGAVGSITDVDRRMQELASRATELGYRLTYALREADDLD